MKKFISFLLLLSLIVTCAFAFTACSKDSLYLLDEWDSTNDNAETYCTAILEFTAKSTLKINDCKTIGGDALIAISEFNSNYNFDREPVFCKNDKIRFKVYYNVKNKPEKAEISINYKNGKFETLVYKF